MYASLWVYVCICTVMCIYVCMSVCMGVYMYDCVHVWMSLQGYTDVCMHEYVCMYV